MGVAAAPVGAAKPIKGAYYAGFDGTLHEFNFPYPSSSRRQDSFQELGAELRVSRSGRRLTGRGRGAYVVAAIDCKGDKDGEVAGLMRLSSRHTRGPRIRKDGSFRAAKRKGRLRYRLYGRFVSPDVVKLVYRASMPPRRPRNRAHRGRCKTRDHPVVLGRNGEPPFRGCHEQPARSLVRGSTGRIFMQYRLDGDGFYPWVFGCLFESKRRVPLSADYDSNTVQQPRLAGTYAAFGSTGCAAFCGHGVEVYNLRNGTRTRNADSRGEVTDVEIKDNGSVAWISAEGCDPINLTCIPPSVTASDAAGNRQFDSGKISPRSLTLSGSTLTWRKDGVVHSAILH